jgi:hypothetical protein
MTLLSGLGLPSVASAAVGVPTAYMAPAEYASSAPPSRDKPQSKLWFHDNAWWALMVGAGSNSTTIHELMPNHTWRNTGALVDARANNTGDALWSSREGKLYVASRAAGSSLQVNGFSYNTATRAWAVLPGFPVTVNSGGASESATIDQDSAGNLWVTYTRSSRLWVAHSTNAAHNVWTAGFQPNVGDTTLQADDLSALITFGSSVGVMWSDQESSAFRFATRDVNAADDAPWQVEDALAGTGLADDHINLKQLIDDPQGRVYAAVKTSTGDDPAADPNAAQVGVLTRTPGANGAPGTWTFTAAGTVAQDWTRPILMIDRTNRALYFFVTSDEAGSGGDILYRKATLSTDPGQRIVLGPVQAFIDVAPNVNNASGAKDPVTGATGLVILATAHSQNKYVHGEMALAPGGRFDGPSGDTTRPTITATAPTSGATGVVVSSNVTATFSENVLGVSDRTFTLATAGGTAVQAAVSYNSATRVATLDPSADLAANTQYTATVAGGTAGVTDLAGNPLASTVTWTFTTAAAAAGAPVVTNRSPAPDARSVAVDANVTATFDRVVQNVNDSTFTLVEAGTGAPVGAVVGFDAASRVATLNPNADLAPDTRYRATLTTGISDTSGNALAADDSWEFVTGPAPTVTDRTPAENATGVGPSTNVTATFSEQVQNVTGTTFTLTSSGGTVVPATVTQNGTTSTWTLDPSADLADGTQYTVTVTGGTAGVTDLAGNPLASTVTWNFTTAGATVAGPVVTNRSPASEARSVAVGTNVTATFDKVVQNVNTGTFTLVNVATGASVAAAVSFKSTTRVATLNPSTNLARDTRYRATLTTGIRDSAGNALAAEESWEFVTGPAPRLTKKSPAANATGVSRTANVTATFNERVQNVETTFTLTSPDGTVVPAQVTQNGTTNTWTLNPDQTLAGSTRYTVTVTGGAAGVTDLAGNPLAASVTWTFTTRA